MDTSRSRSRSRQLAVRVRRPMRRSVVAVLAVTLLSSGVLSDAATAGVAGGPVIVDTDRDTTPNGVLSTTTFGLDRRAGRDPVRRAAATRVDRRARGAGRHPAGRAELDGRPARPVRGPCGQPVPAPCRRGADEGAPGPAGYSVAMASSTLSLAALQDGPDRGQHAEGGAEHHHHDHPGDRDLELGDALAGEGLDHRVAERQAQHDADHRAHEGDDDGLPPDRGPQLGAWSCPPPAAARAPGSARGSERQGVGDADEGDDDRHGQQGVDHVQQGADRAHDAAR